MLLNVSLSEPTLPVPLPRLMVTARAAGGVIDRIAAIAAINGIVSGAAVDDVIPVVADDHVIKSAADHVFKTAQCIEFLESAAVVSRAGGAACAGIREVKPLVPRLTTTKFVRSL